MVSAIGGGSGADGAALGAAAMALPSGAQRAQPDRETTGARHATTQQDSAAEGGTEHICSGHYPLKEPVATVSWSALVASRRAARLSRRPGWEPRLGRNSPDKRDAVHATSTDRTEINSGHP